MHSPSKQTISDKQDKEHDKMDTRQNTIELVNGSTDKKQKTVDNIYTRQLR